MRRAPFTLRSIVVVLSLAAGGAVASCSGDSKEKSPPEAAAGNSNAGAPASAEPIECGPNSCPGVEIPIQGFEPLAPCCVDSETCGLDSAFLADYGVAFSEACQAKNQPGSLGHGCPDSPPLMLPNSSIQVDPLKGCCRTQTETCGYQLDKLLGLIDVGLGCVDSSPFLDGGSAEPCDPN